MKKGKTKENILQESFSRKNTPSLADMMYNLNNNNNNNNSSSSSQKTVPKPFNKNGLINKSQLKLASYIEQNKDITLTGTKRFTDKSGEYYLKNVQLQKKQGKAGPLTKKLSLTKPQNLDNCFNKLNGNINKIRRNATKIITILPENSLTPIPVKEQNSIKGMAQAFNKKQYKNAERVAVFIRRMEYSNGVIHHLKPAKKNNEYINKVIFIQEWWKTMYKILMIQKWTRGFIFRKNLMKLLEHQENILKFITTFYNIHGFHLYRTFFDNLKKMLNAINSKRTEMLEDFSEKMEKIENMNNLRKLKNKFLKWKNKIRSKINKENADNFRKYNLLKKGIMGLEMNNISKLTNEALGEDDEELLDEILNNKNLQNLLRAIIILNKVLKNNNDKTKKEIFHKMKIFYFMNILSKIINRIDNKFIEEALEKIKKYYEALIKKDSFHKWKKIIDLKKILENLKINKQNEIENNKNILSKAFSIWKTKKDIKLILDSLKQNQITKNILTEFISKLSQLKEQMNSDNIKEAFDLIKNLYEENKYKKQQFKKLKIKLVKKESNKINDENKNDNNKINNDELNQNDENKINEENDANPKKFKKRVSFRKRNRNRKHKKVKKGKLKAKLDKLKKVLLLLLIQLYKNKNNKLIKSYFDKWKKNIGASNQKYIKKVILGNSLNKSKDSKFSDKNNNNNNNDSQNNINNSINKCYTFDKDKLPDNHNININPDKIFDKIKKRNEKLNQAFNNKIDENKNEKEIDSDDTSVNVSRMSGIHLEQIKSENLKPVIYTSQSFFIDKNTINEIQNEIPKLNLYKNINNKYPMKMKGDFTELIEKNKDLLKNINPRIQITNATCELEQFSERSYKNNNTNINNINILNLNPNININMNKNYKKKDLKKVVRNCDKDIYEPGKDYDKEQQRWMSMSIPLENDMADWDFLNSVKGIRSKNNINKFELIQKYKSENNFINTNNYNIKIIPNKNKKYEDSNIQNMNYKFNEMNSKQYYKSIFRDEESHSPIKLVKNDKNRKRENLNNRIRSFDIKNINKYINDNIEELPEESFE